MDKFRALTVFVSVAEESSFTGAARVLDMSKTMVSKYIMDLEQDLGTRLFSRTTRRLSLTGAGAAYLRRVRSILEQVEEADGEAAAETVSPRGRLRISAPVSYGTKRIAPLMAPYAAQYPDVSVDLDLSDRTVDLVEDGFDVVIRIGRLGDSSLIARKLGRIRLMTCAAPAYLEKAGRPETPEDLTGHDCLGYTYAAAGDTWHFRRDGKPVAVRVKPRIRCNNGDAISVYAEAGVGIIIQPCFIAGDAIAAGRLEEILTGFAPEPLDIHALYPSTRHVPARVRTFIDFVAAELKDELAEADG